MQSLGLLLSRYLLSPAAAGWGSFPAVHGGLAPVTSLAKRGAGDMM